MAVVFPILPQGLISPDIFGLAKLDTGKSGGAASVIRTRDLTLTKGALYQLSYISTDLERAAGIEPASSAWKAEVIAIIPCPQISN